MKMFFYEYVLLNINRVRRHLPKISMGNNFSEGKIGESPIPTDSNN